MKVTIRSAKMDKDGRHNDRNFDVESASHIDRERMGLNRYYTYNGNTELSFLDLEKEFYKTHFSDYIDSQNERNIKAGHKDRNRTLDEYFHNKRTRPEDVILQIGDVDEHATDDELWECAMKYKEKFQDTFGDRCVILDMALHVDEATPHVHVRRVWISEDERGLESVNQTKCLRDMDIMLPDGSKPDDRYNNRKITFSQMERDMFLQICEDEGFEIERTPGERKRHLSLDAYKEMKASEIDFSSLKQVSDEIINLAMQDLYLREKYRERLERIKEENLEKQIALAREISKDISSEMPSPERAIDEKFESVKLSNEIQSLRDFLGEKGLLSEYDESKKRDSKKREKDAVKEAKTSIPTTSFF